MSGLTRVAEHALGVLRKHEPTTRDDENVGRRETAKKQQKKAKPLCTTRPTTRTPTSTIARDKSSSSTTRHDGHDARKWEQSDHAERAAAIRRSACQTPQQFAKKQKQPIKTPDAFGRALQDHEVSTPEMHHTAIHC
jgi:hypothetical protein